MNLKEASTCSCKKTRLFSGLQLNGCLAASGSYDGTVRLWNVVQGACIAVFKEPANFVRCVGFTGGWACLTAVKLV